MINYCSITATDHLGWVKAVKQASAWMVCVAGRCQSTLGQNETFGGLGCRRAGTLVLPVEFAVRGSFPLLISQVATLACATEPLLEHTQAVRDPRPPSEPTY